MDSGNRRKSNRRIALIIEYNGSNYSGWQKQLNSLTIQEIIENAITVLTKEKTPLIAAGRTDAGVHSLGQIAHFDTNSDIPLQRLCVGLNGIIPDDISIKNAHQTDTEFHSRFSAIEREYKYFIYNSPLRSAFIKSRYTWIKDKLDVNYLNKITNYLIGEHDFKSFCKQKSSDQNTIRTIKSIEIIKKNELIRITIRGNAFLHNMIRIIVGTMLEMSANRTEPEYIKEILKSKNRDMAGRTAPPEGLYLSKVTYNPDLDNFESAY